MNYNPITQYLEPGKESFLVPLDVDVIIPKDYHLYLFYAGDNNWYVVVEVDHPQLSEVVSDIEHSFPIQVSAWCVLKSHQGTVGKELPPNAFREGSRKNNPDSVTYHRGMSYLVLRVTPEEGITETSFGHSAFVGTPGGK